MSLLAMCKIGDKHRSMDQTMNWLRSFAWMWFYLISKYAPQITRHTKAMKSSLIEVVLFMHLLPLSTITVQFNYIETPQKSSSMEFSLAGNDIEAQSFGLTDQVCGATSGLHSNPAGIEQDKPNRLGSKDLIDLNTVPVSMESYSEFHNHINPDQLSESFFASGNQAGQVKQMRPHTSIQRLGSLNTEKTMKIVPNFQDPKGKEVALGTIATYYHSEENPSKKRERIRDLPNRNVKGKQLITGAQNEILSESENIFKSEPLEYQLVRPHLFIGFLQWQFELAVGKEYGLAEEIKGAFESLKNLATSNIPLDFQGRLMIKGVQLAIEKIRTHLIMGVIGGLNVAFWQGYNVSTPINVLIVDAWEFLHKFLKNDFSSFRHQSVSENSEFETWGLLGFAMSLKGVSRIPPRVIHKMLKIWASSSVYKMSIPESALTYPSFIQSCEQACKVRGQGTLMMIQPQLKSYNSKHQDIHLANEDPKTNKVRLASPFKLFYFLKTNGQLVVKSRKAIVDFFVDANEKIRSIFEQNEMKLSSSSENLSENKLILGESLVAKAFKRAKDDITPAFMGLLWMMHQGMEAPETWDDIYESGWEFLNAYLSEWIRYLSENDHPIISNPMEGSKFGEECSNHKEMINYLGNLDHTRYLPIKIIWYLADVWYEKNIILKGNQVNVPSFDVLQPNRHLIKQKYLKIRHHVKDGKESQIGLIKLTSQYS
ncbi:hypothetical protein DFH28DRAFT_921248 [Melampsora americana]|nr:hypothetical protein DFH28DRAFT_921248 [Melampsora americana]